MNRYRLSGLIQAITGLVFIGIGTTRLLPSFGFFQMMREGDILTTNGFSRMMGFSSIFMIAWLIIAVAITISGLIRLIRGSAPSSGSYQNSGRYQRYYERENRPDASTGARYSFDNDPSDSSEGPAARLRELSEMLRDGLISQREYDEKKQQILDDL